MQLKTKRKNKNGRFIDVTDIGVFKHKFKINMSNMIRKDERGD